jgi:hypothetical protein
MGDPSVNDPQVTLGKSENLKACGGGVGLLGLPPSKAELDK